MISRIAEHGSNERTFLSWVRTVMSIEGFGLVAARLGSDHVSGPTEIGLLATGAVVIVLAFIRMRHLHARINADSLGDDNSVIADALMVALVVALMGLFAAFVLHVSPSGG